VAYPLEGDLRPLALGGLSSRVLEARTFALNATTHKIKFLGDGRQCRPYGKGPAKTSNRGAKRPIGKTAPKFRLRCEHVLNKHYEEDGAIVFREACKLGCEGIVSKRLGSVYRRGRSPLWLKVKNPNAPAVKREAEEDWGR